MTRRTRNLAAEALDLAQGEPTRAIELATQALAAEPDAREAAVAWWALGLAKRETDDLEGASEALATAIETAEGAGDPAMAAEIRSSLAWTRSEEHTSELQSRENLVCRLLLEKKK